MFDTINQLETYLEPLGSPLLVLLLAVLAPVCRRRLVGHVRFAAAMAALVVGFYAAYTLAARVPDIHRWLAAINQPLLVVLLVLVVPAFLLPRNRGYKLFLVFPALLLGLAVVGLIEGYRSVPADARGFYWFLIRPSFLMVATASLLILLQPRLSLARFRFAVQLAAFVILMYGGFAFRQNYTDYQEMHRRRADTRAGVLALTETVPVVKDRQGLAYLPSAPCRFSADGGYVQGCTMELLQRMLQVDFRKATAGDVAESNMLGMCLGALLTLTVFAFVLGRLGCGWICPLSFLGSWLDRLRRRLGLPHLKPPDAVKRGYFYGGLSLMGLTLAMAKLLPRLDEKGAWHGCKLPLYPFCKICPGSQVCPVASAGLSAWPGLPGTDWLFGFFTFFFVVLLVVFLASFAIGRRLWCYLCPMGMFAGVFNRGGLVGLTKDVGRCNRCGVCAEVCPMDLDRVRTEMAGRNVASFDCVLCLKCVERCPKDDCLALEWAGRRVIGSRFETVAKVGRGLVEP